MRATATRNPLSKRVMAFRIQKYLGGLRYPATHLRESDRFSCGVGRQRGR
jgi:hypothetical protein